MTEYQMKLRALVKRRNKAIPKKPAFIVAGGRRYLKSYYKKRMKENYRMHKVNMGFTTGRTRKMTKCGIRWSPFIKVSFNDDDVDCKNCLKCHE